MKTALPLKAHLAMRAVDLFPEPIRKTLIADRGFCHGFGLAPQAVLSFGHSGISFTLPILFDAIRRALRATTGHARVRSTAGTEWGVEFLPGDNPQRIALARGKIRFFMAHFVILSHDRETRIRAFSAEAQRVNFPGDARTKWETLLKDRPCTDAEAFDLFEDLKNTPVGRFDAIRSTIGEEFIGLDILVPGSLEYYERLVGKHEDGMSVARFIAEVIPTHLRQVLESRPKEAYPLALTIAADPRITQALAACDHELDVLHAVYDGLMAEDDVFLRLVGIEVGLNRIDLVPELADPIARLTRAIMEADEADPVEPFRLLSALFVLVTGNMASRRLLVSKPPYWRRLAAFAQAVLIARATNIPAVDKAAFAQSAMETWGMTFLMQSYSEMREEPLWSPELILAEALKNELGTRVVVAARSRREAVERAGLAGLLLETGDGSLAEHLDFLLIALPGPLEGGAIPPLEISAEELANVQVRLLLDHDTPALLASIAARWMSVRIPVELADAMADAIERAGYRIDPAAEEQEIVLLLVNLASLAATSRSHRLADVLFLVLRKWSQTSPFDLAVDREFRIAIIACASRADLLEWCKVVGQFVTNMAFRSLAKADARQIHAQVVRLCRIVPELWSTCGAAEAALRSVLGI